MAGRSCRGGSKYQCSNYQLNQNTWEIMSWGLPTYVESYNSLTETSTRAPVRISMLRMVVMMMMLFVADDEKTAPARDQHVEDGDDDDDVAC